MMKKNRILHFLVLILVGCQSAHYTADEYVTLKRDIEMIDDSVLFNHCIVLKLEMTEESMISRVDKILLFDNKIGVLDRSLASLFVFNDEGSFLYTIHQIGNGPGEYIKLYDVCIDTLEKKLAFFTGPDAVLYYDYLGRYLNGKKLDGLGQEIEINGSLQYIRMSDYINQEKINYSIKTVNIETGEENYILKKSKFPVNNLWSDGKLFLKGKEFWFIQRFENILYKIEEENCQPFYQFNLGKYNLPKRLLEGEFSIENFSDVCFEEGYVFSLTNLVEIDNGFLMNSNLPGFFHFDTVSKELKRYARIIDYNYRISFTKMIPIEGERRKVAFALPDFVVAEMKESLLKLNIEKRKGLKIIDLLEPLSEAESNPILFLYDIR